MLKCKGKKLVLSVGYSHPVEFEEIEGITLGVEGNTKVSIEGINKEVVGQYAAKVRAVRPPEPYKVKVFATLVNMFAVKKEKLVNNR